jgi:STE24 endopeptidase
MHNFLFWLIVIFVVFEFALDQILNLLNQKNRISALPENVKDIYDEAEYRKSQDYGKAHEKLELISSILSFIVILIMLFLNGFAALDNYVRQITAAPLLESLLFFGILFFIYEIIHLPFSIYNTFIIEEKFGFNKTTPKLFIFDKLKGLALGIIIGGGLLSIIIWFYNQFPASFWWMVWILIIAFQLFFAMFYTSVLLPVFNKLTPLPEGSLRTAIENYAMGVKFSLRNVFIMDGSKRSTKANAFFSGMGPKKSIVLFDTLLKKYSDEELVAILAHEVGHYKKRHIVKSLALSTIQTGILLFVFNLMSHSAALMAALGVTQNSFHISMLAFGLLYAPIELLLGIGMNMYSRKNEFEADYFSLQTFPGSHLATSLKKLSRDSLSNLTPHPAYVFVHYSHPPLAERLRAMNS